MSDNIRGYIALLTGWFALWVGTETGSMFALLSAMVALPVAGYFFILSLRKLL